MNLWTSLAIFALVLPSPALSAATFHIALDESAPLQATMTLEFPTGRTADLVLGIGKRQLATLIGTPVCNGTPLPIAAPGRWTIPATCRIIGWKVSLRDQDRDGLDASDPAGAWSARARWWLLTDHLAFPAPSGGWDRADVVVSARFRGDRETTSSQPFPARGQMPYYAMVSAAGPRLYRSGDFTLRVYGAVPPEAGNAQQRFFADTWSRWRRDVLPAQTITPAALDVLWIPPPPHADPAFMASAGMQAVLMQNIPGPDKAASEAKLRAAVVLGVHEGFHTIIGAVQGTWPKWVDESWASYFAWRAGEAHLDPVARKAVKELIDAPASPSLLAIEAQVDHGDDSKYDAFYGKGARFWAAIDAVLVTRRNPTGRLAALIQDTHGLQGLDWSNPDGIARYLDARSAGRAAPIVRCYLVRPDCG